MLEEIIKEFRSMPDTWHYKPKVELLIQELEKLQQENERYKEAKDRAQIMASHFAYQMDRYGSVDARDAFEKAQKLYEYLKGE